MIGISTASCQKMANGFIVITNKFECYLQCCSTTPVVYQVYQCFFFPVDKTSDLRIRISHPTLLLIYVNSAVTQVAAKDQNVSVRSHCYWNKYRKLGLQQCEHKNRKVSYTSVTMITIIHETYVRKQGSEGVTYFLQPFHLVIYYTHEPRLPSNPRLSLIKNNCTHLGKRGDKDSTLSRRLRNTHYTKKKKTFYWRTYSGGETTTANGPGAPDGYHRVDPQKQTMES